MHACAAQKVTIEFELPRKGSWPPLLVPTLIAVFLVVTVSIIIIFKRRKFGREAKLKFLKSRAYRC
jgi:ribose/xylose/arabinose/galactoside ABC-type transport system permease subunit